ncbi:MAG TPA: hypothetical protein VF778_08525 [Xanthobacteraceae bacterium]
MANLDVGTGSDPGAGGPPPGGPGGGAPGGPGGSPRIPFQPPGAMQRMRPSMPGAGNIGDALAKCAQAAQLLKQAMLGFPHGSKEGNEVNRCLGILGKIGPAGNDVAQTNVTGIRDQLRQAVQMALANRARQVQGANPSQPPTTAAPGV